MLRAPTLLGVGKLDRLTFSQSAAMRECRAKALVQVMRLDGQLPRPSPTKRSLIGEFHHFAMQVASTTRNLDSLDVAIEKEIARIQAITGSLPLLRREGAVSSWDEVNRSASLAARLVTRRGSDGAASKLVEKELRSKDGVLVGRPDHLLIAGRRAVLREYKSGAIRERGGEPISSYVDQMLFYSALIYDSFDVTAVDAHLESLVGDSYEIRITRSSVEEFVLEIRQALRELNASLADKASVEQLAKPGKDACGTCSARVVCERFKTDQDKLALKDDQYLVEGVVTDIRNPNGGMVEMTLSDKYRRRYVIARAPASEVSEVPTGGWLILENMRLHGSSFVWDHSSQVFYRD